MNCIKVQNSLVELKCSVCGCVQLGKALYVLEVESLGCDVSNCRKHQS